LAITDIAKRGFFSYSKQAQSKRNKIRMKEKYSQETKYRNYKTPPTPENSEQQYSRY
jgi:hypothetical protein